MGGTRCICDILCKQLPRLRPKKGSYARGASFNELKSCLAEQIGSSKPVQEAARRCSTARCFCVSRELYGRCSLTACLPRRSAAWRLAPAARLRSSAFGVARFLNARSGPHQSAPHCSAPHRSALIARLLVSSSLGSSSVSSSMLAILIGRFLISRVGSHHSTPHRSTPRRSARLPPLLVWLLSSSHSSPRPSAPATWLFDALHLEPRRARESHDTDIVSDTAVLCAHYHCCCCYHYSFVTWVWRSD